MNDRPTVIDFANLISASVLRLRMKSPFFGTLALFARFVPDSQISTAATDGRDLFFNPEFLQSLPIQHQDSLILHEILHAALSHPARRRERQPELWNIAADIIVNGTILQQSGMELPPGSLRDERWENFSVEEVYELLQLETPKRFQLPDRDLLSVRGDCQQIADGDRSAAYWRQALQQAMTIASKCPVGIDRELAAILVPQLDWRSYLWRYLVQTPTDFEGFDRRFVGRGLYLETLQCASVRVYVAVDTSGSVKDRQIQLFISEVRGILTAYPHLECSLYYVDCEISEPHLLQANSQIPAPVGGGGTSFVPFFDRIEQSWDGQTQSACVYLTDGYGEFPTAIPQVPTLWVVAPGGLDLPLFPFGEAVRLIDFDRSCPQFG
jgi:predicted metal-dependent peptidase